MRKTRTSYTYFQDTQTVPWYASVHVLNRPHSITADVEIPRGGAEGVLLCQGTGAGGYSFYIKDGKLQYVHNYVSRALYHVVSVEPVPEGRHQLRFEFELTGQPDIPQGQRHAGARPALHRWQTGWRCRYPVHNATRLQPRRPDLWRQSRPACHARILLAVQVHRQDLRRDGGCQRRPDQGLRSRAAPGHGKAIRKTGGMQEHQSRLYTRWHCNGAMSSRVRILKRSTVGGTKATHENPRKEKSHSPFHLGSPEGELLVRPTGHVSGSDPAGLGDVLGRCTHPQ